MEEFLKRFGDKIPWKPVPDSYSYNAGDLIRFNDGEIIMVGTINELGGSCDCCVYYTGNNIAEYCTLTELICRIGPNAWNLYKIKEG